MTVGNTDCRMARTNFKNRPFFSYPKADLEIEQGKLLIENSGYKSPHESEFHSEFHGTRI